MIAILVSLAFQLVDHVAAAAVEGKGAALVCFGSSPHWSIVLYRFYVALEQYCPGKPAQGLADQVQVRGIRRAIDCFSSTLAPRHHTF
jgi:hypothetical protein